ncbi:helix-hairpin-helix domain-containing protein [Vreelandella arcis]|uniref:Helix-hairpin-helix domain-containing protein n=1 Tax=Vreelandella arcis TaxID=416873 RepID=A0A1H0FB28_9GAMM|nr:helix-hairpin-helix domain-containing protein [Halomonas arcis]SDN91669.1 hypothetical protein SAMN04487951_109182 [Halomonas arcis]
MTDTAQQSDSCLEAVRTLCQTIGTLLDQPATESLLITAMNNHQIVHQALTADTPSAATLAALARTEQFIIVSADAYYRQLPSDAATSLNETARMTLFGNRLIALDGIGPATAKQLFERGIFTPEQLFALPDNALEALDLPPASRARITTLHHAHHVSTPD